VRLADEFCKKILSATHQLLLSILLAMISDRWIRLGGVL
jgi:hypothetical protein